MSSALTTFGSDSYILRNAVDAATSSARRVAVLSPTWAKSRSSKILLISVSAIRRVSPRSFLVRPSQILRRAEVLMARGRLVGRVGHDLLEQQVHEQKE